MNPNHYLAVAIHYLLGAPADMGQCCRGQDARVEQHDRPRGGRTRAQARGGAGRLQVVLAAAWLTGSFCFGGEESAGASFLRRDGSVWTTDKDGIILGLLAAEITAVTGKDPGQHYQELTAQYGTPHYVRIDAPATPGSRRRRSSNSPATRSPPRRWPASRSPRA